MIGFRVCLIAVHLVSSEASKLSKNEDTKTEDNFQATLKNEDGDGFCKASGFHGHALFYKQQLENPWKGAFITEKRLLTAAKWKDFEKILH